MAKAKNNIDIQGDISVSTENILPIIKKWLYSEHEIFLRELISNAFDAITKIQHLKDTQGIKNCAEKGLINIQLDEKAKTITISDNGIGLDAEEVQKYINQIAFSGAEDFVKQFKDKDEKSQIIGHFGLGFYSAFIVSSTVEIKSLSYKEGAESIHWSCDGSTKFNIVAGDKKEVGTDIILNVDDESKDYLKEDKIKELVQKFSNFLPVEIQVNGKKVNEENPLWIKSPKDVKKEEYEEFYQKLFPFNAPPLFWIHLNVDYPFNLKGILYFPKIMHELDSSKGRIKLFCQQVFVSDDAKEVVPEFLTLLQGAIDCPDIPLNVSRSYLQNDPYVMKISKHIVKKVADKLNEMYKKDKNQFEQYWKDINPFIKYGMMNNTDFYDKTKDIVIFPSSNGYETNIPDYLERNKEKNENTVVYCTNKDQQATYVNLAKEQGIEVIFLQSVIDSHFLQFLESKDTKIKYQAVDSNLSEHMIDKDKESKVVDPKDNKTSSQKLEDIFKNVLNDDKLKIKVESLKTESVSGMILQSEQAKRMQQMSIMMKQDLPPFEDNTLVVNSNSAVAKRILKVSEELGKEDVVDLLCQQVYDLAMMSQSGLTGDKLQAFVDRSNQVLGKL